MRIRQASDEIANARSFEKFTISSPISKIRFLRKILLTASIVIFVFRVDAAKLNVLFEQELDEKTVILKNLPSQIVPINDSMLCFHLRNDKVYLSNYRTGNIKKYELNDLIRYNALAFNHLKIDTLSNYFRTVLDQWKTNGLRTIQVTAITEYDRYNLLIALDISFPKFESVDGKDSLYTDDKRSFLALVNKERFTLETIIAVNLKWVPQKNQFESPLSGLGVYNETIYIGNIATPEYSGRILSLFDKTNFSRKEEVLNINHKPFQNVSGLPLLSNFYINTSSGKPLVCNRTEVYDLSNGVKLFDLAVFQSDIHQISFIAPLGKDFSTFFFSYSADFDTVSKSFPKFTAVFEAKSSKVSDIQAILPTVFTTYQDKIITLEKRTNTYNYVVYQIR